MVTENKIPQEVVEKVQKYLEEHLPKYMLLKIKRKSNHPDDSYLYMVEAKKDDGTFACWTCFNTTIGEGTMNHGHYGLASEEDCERIFEEFFCK